MTCAQSAPRLTQDGTLAQRAVNSSASQWLSREQERLCSGHPKVHFETILEGSGGGGGVHGGSSGLPHYVSVCMLALSLRIFLYGTVLSLLSSLLLLLLSLLTSLPSSSSSHHHKHHHRRRRHHHHHHHHHQQQQHFFY